MIKAFSGKLSQLYEVLYHMDAVCPVSAIVPRERNCAPVENRL